MNYEKKYNEALAKARTFYKKWDGVDAYNSSLAISELKEIFPELKESGEEKLRKEMLQIAKESEDSFYMVLTPKKRETLIAWLEKQGNKDEEILILKDQIESFHSAIKALKEAHKFELEKQGEHNIVCSEEQMKVLDEVLTFAANHESPYWNYYIFGTLNNLIRQLKTESIKL
jgi:hypothetical protein